MITRENTLEQFLSIYRISGPALLSFSGGRTSGIMLHEILQAYDGLLPDNIKVAFANTGKEREETLRFVHECSSRWGVKVHWLEWRADQLGFEEVGYNSAARAGEPFEALIVKKGGVPNELVRFCTTELKLRTIERFCLSIGWEQWTSIIGLRYDEGARLLKMYDRNATIEEARSDPEKAKTLKRKKFSTRFISNAPLAKAKVTKRDVMEFWKKQPFDLNLTPGEGNCDLCFLKGKKLLKALMHRDPESAVWWVEQEKKKGMRFRARETYSDLLYAAISQMDLFDDMSSLEDEHDVECGLLCAAEA